MAGGEGGKADVRDSRISGLKARMDGVLRHCSRPLPKTQASAHSLSHALTFS